MGHRTALITAASIAVVVLAAAIAAGANLGILNAADSRPVGTLSAATVVQTSTTKAVRAHASGKTAAGADASGTQEYVIKKAGTVNVAAGRGALRLVDVKAGHGWTWALEQTADKRLTVTFRSGSKTYVFRAALGGHSSIVARVDEPVTRVVPSLASSGGSTYSSATPATGTASASSYRPAGDEGSGGEADD